MISTYLLAFKKKIKKKFSHEINSSVCCAMTIYYGYPQ